MRTNLLQVMLGLAVALATANSPALDYLARPVPASFVQDSNTTFLVLLTSPKTQADFSLGNSALTVDPAGFVPGVGYRGTVGFATSRNFPTNAWTVEMILQLPYAAASLDPIVLGGWSSNPSEFEFDLHLEKGAGVRSKMYCWNSQDGFQSLPYAGGNGRSIQASATDKQVYVAFGCDFAAQRYMAAAREVGGDLLNQDINFASSPWLNTNFLSGFPTNQQAAELARRWQKTAARFAQSLPASFTLGHSAVQIRAIRLSNRYRPEIFQVSPVLPQSGSVTWTPQAISPVRATNQTVLRTVGYAGYNNFVTMPVNEPYLPLTPGSASVSIALPNLPVGLYSCFLYGAVDPKGRASLARVWKPCPMDFQAVDAGGSILARGRMLLKQALVPRRMQGFQFHLDSQATNVTLIFSLPTNALETAWIQQIILVDQLAGFPNVAIKQAQYLAIGASNRLPSLTQARKDRDLMIWNALPPLNTPLQVNAQVVQFETPPAGAAVHAWVTKAFTNVLDYNIPKFTFSPLDFLDTNNGTVFPQSNILSVVKWPSPYGEDPTGVFFSRTDFPALATDIYNTERAELLGQRYLLFAGAVMNSRGSLYGLDLPLTYFNGGDPQIGHDAAMALVRLAYDWPALEMSLHEVRLCTHSPDFEYNTDWSSETLRNGKMQYGGWSGNHAAWLLESYDQVFPYIRGNQVFADAVHRFIPWVNTPQDVIRLLDRYLVYSSVRDSKLGLIEPSAGIEDLAGQVLGPSPYTTIFFDLTKQYSLIYPTDGGTYQEMYATALSRSGVEYIASFEVYAFGTAQALVTKASRIKGARLAGVPVPMDISDVAKYPKVRSAGNFMLDMWVAGGFPFMVGDASGGTHYPADANSRLGTAATAINQAFDLYGDPRHAWILKNLLGNSSPAVDAAAAGITNPVLNATSHVVPDYGAILELTPAETNVLKKTSATLRLGIGSGHSHHDYLDLNLFGLGLPLAVDLACRNEGNFWSRPGANWSFLHNHALAHDSDDPNGAGAQTGEPWLNAFAPPLVRASYVDQSSSVQLDRDVILMEVGETGTHYSFDVQRLRGGTYHTWAFHGCESDALQLNVPTQPQTNRWTDRLLEGTQRAGTATNKLQATWTMTRSAKSVPHTFNGGGIIQTVGCEPAVLGPSYNPALPPVNVRATLLGRQTDKVLQGNPYSEVYQYSFPFLWAQSTNQAESVYPAVYEWYRGTNPIVANAEIIRQDPLQARITTTSGQVDTYDFTPDHCLAVSRDTNGVRWLKLSGSAQIALPDLSLSPATNYDVTITSIDYTLRHLTTSGPLPDNPGVTAGNNGRRIFLQLHGSGNSFSWDDDLLVREGQITSLHITGPNTLALSANQSVLFEGSGNRKAEAMTDTTEDGQWQFRGSNVVHGPVGMPLTTDVFTDANGDGFINVKTYEIGPGDHITVPVEMTIQRRPGSLRVQTNVPLSATVNGTTFALPASSVWRDVSTIGETRSAPPSGLRVIPLP